MRHFPFRLLGQITFIVLLAFVGIYIWNSYQRQKLTGEIQSVKIRASEIETFLEEKNNEKAELAWNQMRDYVATLDHPLVLADILPLYAHIGARLGKKEEALAALEKAEGLTETVNVPQVLRLRQTCFLGNIALELKRADRSEALLQKAENLLPTLTEPAEKAEGSFYIAYSYALLRNMEKVRVYRESLMDNTLKTTDAKVKTELEDKEKCLSGLIRRIEKLTAPEAEAKDAPAEALKE